MDGLSFTIIYIPNSLLKDSKNSSFYHCKSTMNIHVAYSLWRSPVMSIECSHRNSFVCNLCAFERFWCTFLNCRTLYTCLASGESSGQVSNSYVVSWLCHRNAYGFVMGNWLFHLSMFLDSGAGYAWWAGPSLCSILLPPAHMQFYWNIWSLVYRIWGIYDNVSWTSKHCPFQNPRNCKYPSPHTCCFLFCLQI